jgi:Ca2+-binding RTX toxin-like protein
MTNKPLDLATLSKAVYEGPKDGYAAELPPGYQFITASGDTESSEGYFGAAFKSGNTVVIAHRGTDSFNDVDDDYAIFVGKHLPDQVKEAEQFTKKIRAKYGNDVEIIHTGHSLGGGVAQVMALMGKGRAVSFDNPGIKGMALNNFGISSINTNKITAYVSAPNAINTAGEHLVNPIQLDRGFAPQGDYDIGVTNYLSYSYSSHQIKEMISSFDQVTGQPISTIPYKQWPQGFDAGYNHYVQNTLANAKKAYIVSGIDENQVSKLYNIPVDRIVENTQANTDPLGRTTATKSFTIIPDLKKAKDEGKSYNSGSQGDFTTSCGKDDKTKVKTHTVSKGDTVWTIANNHGKTVSELLNVPGNEYLKDLKKVDAFGRESYDIKYDLHKINIPSSWQYQNKGWSGQSDYGDPIQNTNKRYDFMSDFNTGKYGSAYGFAKNVYSPYQKWNNEFKQGGSEFTKAMKDMDATIDRLNLLRFSTSNPSGGQKSYYEDTRKSSGNSNSGSKDHYEYTKANFKTNFDNTRSDDFKKYSPPNSEHHYSRQYFPKPPEVNHNNDDYYPPNSNFHDTIQYRYSDGKGRILINKRFAFPLVIDLDGDGIELLSLDNSTAFFDIDNDGYLKNLGWSSKKDAFLAVDINQDGNIRHAPELSFKLWDEKAITDLDGLRLVFDTNKDGKINEQDQSFNLLVVWQDANQNGISEQGELKTLQEAGISEILLDKNVPINQKSKESGNKIIQAVALVTDGRIKGALYDVALQSSDAGIFVEENEGSVDLKYDNSDKVKILKVLASDQFVINLSTGNYTIGIGDDRSQNFTANKDRASIMDGAGGDDLFFGSDYNDWAKGGKGKDSFSMGRGHDILLIDSEDDPKNIDGGEGYDIAIVSNANPVELDLARSNIEAAYGNKGSDKFTARNSSVGVFIDGGEGDDEIEGSNYDDILVGGKGKDKIRGYKGDDIIYIDAEDDLQNIDAGDGQDTVYVIGNKAIKKFNPGLINAERISLSGFDDELICDAKCDKLIVFGNKGKDFIHTGSKDDYIDGGADDDTLSGGLGNDSYAFYVGAGHDKIINHKREVDRDRVLLYQSIILEDIIFKRVDGDLKLSIRGNDKDSLTVLGWYQPSFSEEIIKQHKSVGVINYKIDEFIYNAGSDNPQLIHLRDQGDNEFGVGDEHDSIVFTMDGNDKVSGGKKNDFISLGDGKDEAFGDEGDDILAGGPGDGDYLRGWLGNDTYLYNSGDGKDIIYDNYQYTKEVEGEDAQGKYKETVLVEGDGGEADKIRFGKGIKPSDLAFEKDGEDILIGIKKQGNQFINLSDIITVKNWFNDFNKIEYLTFVDHDLKIKIGNLVLSTIKHTCTSAKGSNNSHDILEAIDGRSTRLSGSNAIMNGSDKKDYLYVHSGNYVNAGDGDDALFVFYENETNILNGGIGKDQFVFIANEKELTKEIVHIIEDFNKKDDLIELRGFGLRSVKDLKLTQNNEDTFLEINKNCYVRIKNTVLNEELLSRFSFSWREELKTPGNITAKEGIDNHLFGSSENDVMSGNNASFVHLFGGKGDDLLKTNGAKYSKLEGNEGNDTIEVDVGSHGRILYRSSNLSAENFGNDHIYCDFINMKIELDRKEQVSEMMSYLTKNNEELAVFATGNWSITLHGVAFDKVNASIFSVWEEV